MAQGVATLVGPEIDETTRVYRKVTWRLIPFLFACYVAAYLDRVNVGFAKLQMLSDLKFSETVYGLGAGIFFIGYFLFEVPSNMILHRVGARLWIARVMLSWALISAAMMFVTTPTVFYVLRFLLGIAEAGLFPGVILYLTYWYPSERRGGIIAMFMTGIPVAGLVGGPLSGLDHEHAVGRPRAGRLAVDVPDRGAALARAGHLRAALSRRRHRAGHVADPPGEDLLARTIAADASTATAHRFRDGFTSPWVWLLAAIYFFFVMGLYGVGFWLPTLIKGAGVSDPLTIGMLTTLPYGAAAVAMIAVGTPVGQGPRAALAHLGAGPDRRGRLARERAVQHEPRRRRGRAHRGDGRGLVTLAQFWCLPTAVLAGAAAATGIAVINSVGNLAGFVSPYLIGWIIDTTKSTSLGIYTLAACLAVGSLLALTMPRRLVNRWTVSHPLQPERGRTMLDDDHHGHGDIAIDLPNDSAGRRRTSIYQPEQAGLIFPEIPEFKNHAEERAYRKQHLVAACRAFAMHGFDYGFAGHLTIRDPEHPELYWTNPMCVHFSQVRMSNLILADHDGRVVEGRYAINRAGFVLHAAVHEEFPDVMAMCHAHTTYGTAWCATGRPLDMISQDAAAFYDSHAVIGASAGAVAVEKASGLSVAQQIGRNRGVLHQNHGLLTCSRHSIDDAAFWFIALERACQQQLLVEATGIKAQTVSEKTARYSREHVGSDYIGWLHFQTLYSHIAATQPDMFA